MSIASTQSGFESLPPQDIPLESLKRFTVDQYHALLESGFFAEDEDLELLEGLLVKKMGKKRGHSLATRRLRQLLEKMLHGYYVDAQEPVTTGDSEPEPDASIVRGQPEDYQTQQPAAKDVALVAEVSDKTLSRDRRLKKRIYAAAGIPVYWIVNLVNRQVEVYTLPGGQGDDADYGHCFIFTGDDEVPVEVHGREVGRLKVSDILP